MKGTFVFCLVVAILVIMIQTNPREEAHRKAVSDYIVRGTQEKISNDGDILGFISKAMATAISNKFLEHTLVVDNYAIFSCASISYMGKSKKVSTGIFGKVFLTKEFLELLKV